MLLLSPGDSFPALSLTPPGKPARTLPDALGGEFGVILFFRGSWCPYCNAQLQAFQRASDGLASTGILVAALSVDDEPATAELIARHGLTFPVGHSADATAIAALTGAFVNRAGVPAVHRLRPRPGRAGRGQRLLQRGLGRSVSEDVIGLVRYLREHSPA